MNVDISKPYDLQMINAGKSVFCIMNVDISKHYDLQMINEGLKYILHNDCGYFKTLWLANDKWGFKVYFA